MARPNKEQTVNEETPVNVGETAEETAPAAATTSTGDERLIKIKDPETGELIARKDYIVKQWKTNKYTRGEIAKQLSEITGKKVPYQIVFQATNKLKGYGKMVERNSAAAEPAPAESSDAVTTTE